jgi:predicted CoA-binding protein
MAENIGETVVILGASDNPSRYSNKALRLLQDFGHKPLPVHPQLREILGYKVYSSLTEVPGPVDTLTMYVNPGVSSDLKEDILKLKPKRVIFNPGSENAPLAEELKMAGVDVVENCTLVMLRSGSF